MRTNRWCAGRDAAWSQAFLMMHSDWCRRLRSCRGIGLCSELSQMEERSGGRNVRKFSYPSDGTLVDPSVEMYPRNEAGRLGPMLGVVGQLVPALECFKTVVIERNNDERIIACFNIGVWRLVFIDLSL